MRKSYSFCRSLFKKVADTAIGNFMLAITLAVVMVSAIKGQSVAPNKGSSLQPEIQKQGVTNSQSNRGALNEQKVVSYKTPIAKQGVAGTVNGEVNSLHKKWSVKPFDQQIFIENKGQFNKDIPAQDRVLYFAKVGALKMYFTSTGVMYKYNEVVKLNDDNDGDEKGKKEEEHERNFKVVPHYISANWEGANSNVSITASQEQSYPMNYGFGKNSTITANAFKKITYNDIYPGIDIEYTFPADGSTGIKYALIVHPGADISQFKYKYQGNVSLNLDADGNVIEGSDDKVMTELMDHAPISSYEGGGNVSVSYKLNGAVESFAVNGDFDKTQTLIVDPLTSAVDPGFSGSYDIPYDIGYDNAGNVFAYGAYSDFQLVKISPAGAILWHYTTTWNSYGQQSYGDFVVDRHSGECYIGNGWDDGNPTGVVQISTAGHLLNTYGGSNKMLEIWRMAYDPCNGDIVIGGGGINSGGGQVAMLDTNLTTFSSSDPYGTKTGNSPSGHDVDRMCLDPITKTCYFHLTTTASDAQNHGANDDNVLMSVPIPALTPASGFLEPTNEAFSEIASVNYVGPGYAGGTAIPNGMNGMAASPKWLYEWDGYTLKQITKSATLPTNATISISTIQSNYSSGVGTSYHETDIYWGGLDADACDNVYVGNVNEGSNQGQLLVYNSSLVLQSTTNLSSYPYAVALGGNDTIIYVCGGPDKLSPFGKTGSGFVEAYTNSISTVTVSANAVSTTCGLHNGSASGSLSLCGTAEAAASITYSWSNGATTSSISGLAAGTYTVTMNIGCGQSYQATAVVGSSTAPTLSATASPSATICSGGSVTLNAGGGTTYTWSTGSTATSISVSPGSSTTYTLTDAACTSYTTSVTVNVNTTPTVSISSAPPTICSGNSTTITAGGASTYTWSPAIAATTSTVSVSPGSTTTYTVTGSSVAGCAAAGTATVAVTVNTTPTVTVSAGSPTICSGNPSVLNASGASTYTWSPGIAATTSTVSVSPTSTKTYTVTGSSVAGCPMVGSATVAVTVNTTPTVAVSAGSPTICSGNSSVLNGSGASTYTWSPGIAATTSTVSVSPGSTTTYTVTGSSAAGCAMVGSATVAVTVNITPTVTISSAPPTICSGNSTTITATGASTYTWSPGIAATTSTVSVSPGSTTTYTVTGSSAAGCAMVGSATVAVTVNTTPTVTASATSPSICSGGSTTLTGNGASTYTWSPGIAATTSTVSVSPTSTQTYTVTGSSAAGCPMVGSATVAVSVSTPPTVSVSATSPTICSGNSTVLTAGNASTYTWSPGGLTGSTVTVSPGSTTTYTVTGTASGCSASTPETVVVTVNTTPTVSVSAGSPTICSGNPSVLNASGASTYTWSPGIAATTSTVSVSPGSTQTYTVTGSSAAGCPMVGSATVAVSVNITPTVTISSAPATICSGNSTTITATGASTYTWSPGIAATTSTVSVSPGSTQTYTVTGSSASGCPMVGSATVAVTVNITPTLALSATSSTICSGNSTTLTAGGATTYTWSPGALTGSTVSVSPTSTTTYTVVGTASSCSNVIPATIAVTVNPTPTLTASANSPTICSDSATVLNVSGASTYTWSPGGLTGSTVSVSPTSTTTYTVVGTASSCSNVIPEMVIVTVNPTPTISVAPITPTICPGGNVNLTASSNPVGAATYAWSPSATLSAATGATVNATPAANTTYTVVGTLSGCPSSPVTEAVTVANSLNVTITPSLASICNGGSTVLNAGGAATYVWTPNTALTCTTCSNPTANPTDTTTYKVVGSSGVCKDSATYTLDVNPTPNLNITLTGISAAVCPGDSMGMSATGATTYAWSPATGLNCTSCANVNAAPAATATYTVTGYFATGCSSTASQQLIVYPQPVISLNLPAATICSGDSVTLIAGGVTSYSWSPPTGLNSTIGGTVIAGPASTITYTVTGKGTGGCSASDSTIITVNATPTVSVSAIPVTPAICSGDSISLNAGGAAQYQWLPATGLKCSTCSATNGSPVGTTTYSVVGTSLQGCKDTNNITVTINPLPTLSVTSSSPTICKGDSALLGANGATSYVWSPSTGLNSTSGATVNAGPGSTATYTVTGTDGNGCISSSSVSVSVNTIAVSFTATQPAVCMGDSTTITANGATSYTWSPSAGLSTTTGTSVVATPTATTTYTVVGLAGTSCYDTNKTVLITVNPLPVVTASPSADSICTGGTAATLSASGATTYVWSPAAGLSTSTGSPVSANPSSNNTYTVTGTDGNGCKNTATVALSVLSPPSVLILAAGGDSLCTGLSKVLSASGATSYVWSTTPAQTSSSITVTPTTSTTYTVTGSNGVCVSTAVVAIGLYAPFQMLPTDTGLCAGQSLIINANATGGSKPYTYLWGNSLGSAASATIVSVAGVTVYTCSVTDACGQTLKDSDIVTGGIKPNAAFTATPDTIPGGQFVGFINSNSNASKWIWYMGDNTSPYLGDSSVLYQYNQPGTYYIKLIVSNGYGCTDTATDEIYVTQNIFIPNVFTPNGDGINDVFHVTVAGMKTYSIEIFNRWGQRIFNTNSQAIDWDGTSTGGVQESDGTYFYLIKMTDFTGKDYNYQGYVQLIRN